jgi:hypothetical protein
VQEWLATYMFAGEPTAQEDATRIAAYFADYERHHSHAVGIDREDAKAIGLKIFDLEDDPSLQDAVLSVHHAAMHTLQGPAIKVVENNLGATYAKVAAQVSFQMPIAFPQPVAFPPSVPVPPLTQT